MYVCIKNFYEIFLTKAYSTKLYDIDSLGKAQIDDPLWALNYAPEVTFIKFI